ncbi:MAG TPA: hypothetical protein VGY58_07610 [Gemmataceae bacterium]|jgi:hypothetical protein|nr:hypothetical protein [Gemmataceae bacterium]
MMKKRLAAWLPAAALLFIVGCGGGVGEITGQVTYNGEPIPVGRITFLSEAGNQEVVSAYIIRGKYTVPRCPAGPAKITIESLEPPSPDVLKGTKQSLALPGMGGKNPAGGMKAPEIPDELKQLADGPPLKHLQIPRDYANPETSHLTYEVRRGNQGKDFLLR